jgi:hypothetical protein
MKKELLLDTPYRDTGAMLDGAAKYLSGNERSRQAWIKSLRWLLMGVR